METPTQISVRPARHVPRRGLVFTCEPNGVSIPGNWIDGVYYRTDEGGVMGDSSTQFDWITLLANNLRILYRGRDDVTVGGNLLWYPEEGEGGYCVAPDVYVVFGRPPEHRTSYRQWQEDDVPMAVVFEILSDSNDDLEMARKLLFYDEHGVREYYIYNPDDNSLVIYERGRAALARRTATRWTSPALGITFDLTANPIRVFAPDGSPFLTSEEIGTELAREKDLRTLAEAARATAEAARATAEAARATAEAARATAEARAARLGELLSRVVTGTATPDELAEAAALSTNALPPA